MNWPNNENSSSHPQKVHIFCKAKLLTSYSSLEKFKIEFIFKTYLKQRKGPSSFFQFSSCNTLLYQLSQKVDNSVRWLISDGIISTLGRVNSLKPMYVTNFCSGLMAIQGVTTHRTHSTCIHTSLLYRFDITYLIMIYIWIIYSNLKNIPYHSRPDDTDSSFPYLIFWACNVVESTEWGND